MRLLLLLSLLVVMVLGLAGVASAQATVPNVRGLRAFTAEAKFMSLPGYLRWQYFQETGAWVTWGEAVAMVRNQLVIAAVPSE